MKLTKIQIENLESGLRDKDDALKKPKTSFLTVTDLSKDDFQSILKTAHSMKKNPFKYKNIFQDKKIALLFQKTSTRTKESFVTGAHELGIYPSYINWRNSNFTLSSLEDEIRVLSQWYDLIMARVYHNEDLQTMDKYSEVPIINGLCDKYHPCQSLADIQTMQEYFGMDLSNVKLTYLGDGNNVCNSLIQAASLAGIGKICIATPDNDIYKPLFSVEDFAREHTDYEWVSDPFYAVKDANIIYTDTWVSMGQEEESSERENVFKKFQVNEELLKYASENYIFMHDLPAHVEKEVTSSILRGKQSVVFQQAQNRKHAQKALMSYLLDINS